MVPSVIYLLRKFLEAVIPLGLGAFLCHSLNDLVSDSVLGTVQGPAGQGCMEAILVLFWGLHVLAWSGDHGRGRTFWQPLFS